MSIRYGRRRVASQLVIAAVVLIVIFVLSDASKKIFDSAVFVGKSAAQLWNVARTIAEAGPPYNLTAQEKRSHNSTAKGKRLHDSIAGWQPPHNLVTGGNPSHSLQLPNLSLTSTALLKKVPVNADVLMANLSTVGPFRSPYISQFRWVNYNQSILPPQPQTKLIFFHNAPEWYDSFEGHFRGCPVQACEFTIDPEKAEEADAVMVYTQNYLASLPILKRRPRQVWIALNLESPSNSDQMSTAWAAAFNWTMDYRVDADIFNPYGFLYYRPSPPHIDYAAIAAGKNRLAAWFVSSCRTKGGREKYVRELQQHMQVDVYGSCGTLQCPRHQDSGRCLPELTKTYFFYLAFENSVCRDYVTEKFFKLFEDRLHVIPVVRGGANYTKYFPPGTFIDAANFSSPLELADHLKRIAAEKSTYVEMLRQKHRYIVDHEKIRTLPRCSLCWNLHYDKRVRHYADYDQWVGSC